MRSPTTTRSCRCAIGLGLGLLLAPCMLACSSGGDGAPDATPANDGGHDEDAGIDDAGPGDGGGDAGCGEPSCQPCEAGGARCDDGGVCLDGGCQTACLPGSQACEGVRLRGCGDGGTYAPPASCALGTLCQGEVCVAVSTCAGSTPPCCSTPAECEGLAELYTCSECRPTIRSTACLDGACVQLPASLDFTVIASTGALPDPTRVSSGVVTVYRGTSADGRPADCAMLLDAATGTSPHDARDPRLDPTLSRPFEFTGGTGSDFLSALLLGVPGGPDQTLVFSVYDGSRGRGQRLGRGCLDHASPIDGATLVLDLLP